MDPNNLIYNLLVDSSKSMINIFALNHVYNWTFSPYSLLLKSFFAFYYLIFQNHEMFETVSNLGWNTQVFPWDRENERNYWIPGWLEENRTVEEVKRDVATWRGLFTMWYEVLFLNPFFYLRWDPITGYGVYCRQFIQNMIDVLRSYSLRHGTFLESITVVEWGILKEFGFDSFIVEIDPITNDTDYYIKFGFWFFANTLISQIPSNNNEGLADISSPFLLKHCYTQGDDDIFTLDGTDNGESYRDMDFIVGNPFRTVVEVRHLSVNREEIASYILERLDFDSPGPDTLVFLQNVCFEDLIEDMEHQDIDYIVELPYHILIRQCYFRANMIYYSVTDENSVFQADQQILINEN